MERQTTYDNTTTLDRLMVDFQTKAQHLIHSGLLPDTIAHIVMCQIILYQKSALPAKQLSQCTPMIIERMIQTNFAYHDNEVMDTLVRDIRLQLGLY